MSTEGRKYKKDVAAIAGVAAFPKGTDVGVGIDWHRARKSGDLDNRIKILLDALKGVAYEDDKQVASIHAYRYDDKANPRVDVTVFAASR